MGNPDRAFQVAAPWSLCFGCGPANENGLQIESRWDGDETVCIFDPQAHHAAGPPGVVNGGIIATVIDCHSIWTAAAHAVRREGRNPEAPMDHWYVTGSMQIEYLRPTPLAPGIELRARVVDVKDRRTRVKCSLSAGGKECARAEITAVEVPTSWLAPGKRDE